MTRITNAMKDAIVENALLKSGVTARLEAVKVKRLDWAERVRIDILGGPEKAAEYAKINKDAGKTYSNLPAGLKQNSSIVTRRKEFYVNLAGLSVTVKLPEYAEASSNREVIAADSQLCQQFHDIEAEENAVLDQGTIVENQVRATLDKFGTIKRLVEAWPEVQELLPPATLAQKSNLPAIQVADLNKLVGLPSEETAAPIQ